MDNGYWYRRHGDEAVSHCANRHRRKEPSDEFSFPRASVRDALKAIFGTEIGEADLAWLAGLLECILRFEDGALVETYLDRVPKSVYRTAAEKLIRVLYAVDEVMMRSGQPSREWQQIALALCLPSSRHLRLTEAGIGRQFGVCTMAVSKSIAKLLRLADLKPHGRGYNGMNSTFH